MLSHIYLIRGVLEANANIFVKFAKMYLQGSTDIALIISYTIPQYN